MNKEQEQIIDEVWSNYRTAFVEGHVHHELDECLSIEEFINKCKTDNEFSEKWGLKIEEREMSFNHRYRLGDYQPYNIEGKVEYEKGLDYITQEQFETFHNKEMDKLNIPTKLITLTYQNEKI
jgi:hypothetical protein